MEDQYFKIKQPVPKCYHRAYSKGFKDNLTFENMLFFFMEEGGYDKI